MLRSTAYNRGFIAIFFFIVIQFFFFILRPLSLANHEFRLQIELFTYRSVFECIKKLIILDE